MIISKSYPFLSGGILEIVHTLRVPLFTQSKERPAHETVLGHDDEVGEETGGSLDHTDLTVRDGDETLVDQLVHLRVTRLALHDVGFGLR